MALEILQTLEGFIKTAECAATVDDITTRYHKGKAAMAAMQVDAGPTRPGLRTRPAAPHPL